MEAILNYSVNYACSVAEEAMKYYDELGWYVVPLSDGNKRPAVKWSISRYPNRPKQKTISKYFEDRPYANVGVITGNRSNGLVVLDFDLPQAYDQFIQYIRSHEFDVCSLIIDKGKQGHHVYFRSELPIRTRHSKLGFPFWGHDKGIDLLAEGGHCVVPPSRHSSGLLNYEWINSPLEQEIPPIPDFLVPFFEVHRQANTVEPTPASSRPGAEDDSHSFLSLLPDDEDGDAFAHVHDIELKETESSFVICVTESISEDRNEEQRSQYLNSKVMSFEENQRAKLCSVMKHPIPIGQSNEYWQKYGIAAVSLFTDYSERLVAWYSMVAPVCGIDEAKAQERGQDVLRKIACTVSELRNGAKTKYQPKLKPDHGCMSNQKLMTVLEGVLSGAVVSEKLRLQAAKLAAYFLACQKSAEANGISHFFRGFEYIIVDIRTDPVFSTYTDGTIKKQLSKLMPFIVKNYRCRRDGEDLNTVSIFECLYKARPLRLGEPRDTFTSEYRLTDGYRWLMEYLE